MKKRLLSFLLVFILICFFSPFSFAEGKDPGKNQDRVRAIENLEKASGGEIDLTEKDGQIFLSGKLSDKQAKGGASALQFLDENKALFGLDDVSKELKQTETVTDEIGHTFVKYIQTIKGIEVEGTSLNVHYDDNGTIVSVNGRIIENKDITHLGVDAISANEAIAAAKMQFTYDELNREPEAEKLITTVDDKNYVVYKVNISYNSPKAGNYDVYVEAYSGEVVRTESNIRYDGPATGTGVDALGFTRNLKLYQSGIYYLMQDISRDSQITSGITTLSMNNSTYYGDAEVVSNTSPSFTIEDYEASVSAHYFAGVVVDFYKNLLNRNSLDNAGMPIYSYTHGGVDYDNAFWDGYRMTYGDGASTSTYRTTYFSADLDVVGHEMTHGVISNTNADLTYHNQPGALNESLADTFGILVETYEKYGVATGGTWQFNIGDWLIGDEICYSSYPYDAFRSMSNPGLYNQPDTMSEYRNYSDTESQDWGGVHINSGIPNKAAYLIAQNIGLEKTARIYYRALVNYMGMYTDFIGARSCLIYAASDLYGVGSAEANAVANAFSTVGVGAPAVNDPYEPNGSVEHAYAINLDTPYQSYVAFGSDSDYYKLEVNDTGNIAITLTGIPSLCDYDLYLYDSNYYLEDYSNQNGQANEEIQYNITEVGTYYICVRPYKGCYSTSQKYTLFATKPVAVSGVSLDNESFNMVKGEARTLVATVDPPNAYNKHVTWISSSTSVATVSTAGKVTAVGNGTAVITATTEDGGFTDTCTVTVTTLYAPTSPKAASAAYNGIRVSWAAASSADGYEVYRATASTGAYTYAGTTASVSYYNTGLVTNKVYYFKVRSYKNTSPKVYSGWTTVVYTRPIPVSPATIGATPASYNSVRVSWGAVAGASRYEIYRAPSSSGAYRLLTSTTALSYMNTGLNTGSTYYYKVRAYHLEGRTKVYGAFTAYRSARPMLGIPASVKATAASYNSVRVTWRAVAGASRYELYRSSSGGSYKLVTATTALAYTNVSLSTGTTYNYMVRAYRLVGGRKVYSSYSTVSSATPNLAVPPSVKAAAASATSIKISWGAVAGAARYEVWCIDLTAGTETLLTDTSLLYFTNTGLTTGLSYTYKVIAYRMVGTAKVYSGCSALVTATP